MEAEEKEVLTKLQDSKFVIEYIEKFEKLEKY